MWWREKTPPFCGGSRNRNAVRLRLQPDTASNLPRTRKKRCEEVPKGVGEGRE